MTFGIRRRRPRSAGGRETVVGGMSRLLSVVLVVAVVSVACRTEIPEATTVRNAFTRYTALQARGDYESLYGLLVREARDRIARTHDNIRRSREWIERHYPPSLREQALADLGPPEVRDAPTPARFYAALMAASNRPALTVADRLKSNIRRIARTDLGTFVVTTVSGERSEWLEGGDGRFYRVPDTRETARLQQEFLRSVRMLEATQAAVGTFGSRK